MHRVSERVFESLPWPQFTTEDLAALFPGSEDRRYGLVKRALAGGEIIRIRRGLYCLAPQYRKKSINLYALAQLVYGPSYVSLESALSWHGWIPEAVHAVTNASFKKAKEFVTGLGIFRYDRVPQRVFYVEVDRLTDTSGNVFLMATPLKALTDYVYVRKRDWTGIEPAISSLRIPPEELEQVTGSALEALCRNYSHARVTRFLEGLRKDLHL
jgi:predicted transcriptional regulator of viral defense system